MNVVFDFGGVVCNWRPPELLACTLLSMCIDAVFGAACWVERSRGYGGDWGDFDRGNVEPEAPG